MAKNIVVKDNVLINASYSLDLVEQRLILLSISEARLTNQEISSSNYLTIHAEKYINEFDVHRNVAYQSLKDACSHLFERRFTYQKLTEKGNKEIVTSRWVQSISYVANEAIVRLKFSDDVIPLISNLEKHFTSYELEQVSGLNSKYSVRLYEIIIAWRSTEKTPMITVDELRNKLGVLDDEYTVTADFKRWVLDNPIKQINEKTDISVSYEQHKQGRKIIGFTFAIQQKQKNTSKKSKNVEQNKEINKEIETVDLFEGLTDLEREIIQERINEHIKRIETSGEIVSDFHCQNITKKAIAERWGLDVLEKKQAKAKATEEREAKQRAEQQAEQEREAHKRQASEMRKNTMIDLFESLEPEQQEFILDEVQSKVGASLIGMFKKYRGNNTAHKTPMFSKYFYEIFEL